MGSGICLAFFCLSHMIVGTIGKFLRSHPIIATFTPYI